MKVGLLLATFFILSTQVVSADQEAGFVLWETNTGGTQYFPWGLFAGSNITLTDRGDGSITVDSAGGGGNSFETIAVPAGASVVADSATDTLTITETTFLTFTGTAATDTIDITQVTTDIGTDGLIAANAVALTTDTTGNYASSATANEFLLLTGTEGASLGFQDCAANQIPKRNAGDTAWACAADADSGGATAWSAIGDAAGAGDVLMAETVQSLSWDSAATAAAYDALTIQATHDSTTDASTQRGLVVERLDSTGTAAWETLVQIQNNDTDGVVTTGLEILSAAGLLTTAIDLSDAEIGDALLVGANPIAFGNVAGTIGNATADSITLITDGTGTGEVVLPNNSIGAAELASGALAPQTIQIPCPAMLPLEAADAIPPLSKDAGTNLDQLACGFDAAADEGRTAVFMVPSRVESGSTITFRIFWYSLAATTGDAVWDIRHNSGTGADVDPDVALTTLSATDTTAGTAGQMSVTSITVSQTTAAWAANDLVYLVLERDANNAADTLAGDALVTLLTVEIPLL